MCCSTQKKVLLELIATLWESIADFDRQIVHVEAAHPDFAIFDSFPGAGPALALRLLAAFGPQREHFQSPADLQTFSGIAPSPNGAASPNGFRDWAHAHYRQQRDRRADHHAAVLSVAGRTQSL
jgi:transposase